MLAVHGNEFTLNGKPFRILAGAMHYFRVPPAYWRDRLEKMRAFGLNTVETYAAWNMHEPQPGKFDFSGMLDIERFLQIAADVGLKAIVRPGPYICSEWDFGGLPYWLLKDPNLKVRCAYPPYLEAVDRYFNELLPRIAPLQSHRGGPVIAVQVENEYGSYGGDKVYLSHLRDKLRQGGIETLLFTSDGPRDECLQGGTLPDLLATVNFAFEAPAAFQKLRQYRPEGPLMVTEFWSGWFDHWGEDHHVSADGSPSIARSVQALDQVLDAGASLSFYMFHGGTNFGFMSGANIEPTGYRADVTSYDYAAPLDEAGNPSERYWAYREVLGKYVDLPELNELPAQPARSFGTLRISGAVDLFGALDELSKPVLSLGTEPMEAYGQDYGFILYRTRLTGPRSTSILHLRGLHDRAQVYLDGKLHDTLEREHQHDMTALSVPAEGAQLDLLVENMGRVNFGPGLIDRKGILDGVTLADQYLFGWEVYPLPLADLSLLKFRPLVDGPLAGPRFYRGVFRVDEPADTFLALPGWKKGVAWINGTNLGRYWQRGPQQTLYVPGPFLTAGENELIVLELEAAGELVEFRDKPVLG